MYNVYTNQGILCGAYVNGYDGSTADYVIERPKLLNGQLTNLSNFKTWYVNGAWADGDGPGDQLGNYNAQPMFMRDNPNYFLATRAVSTTVVRASM